MIYKLVMRFSHTVPRPRLSYVKSHNSNPWLYTPLYSDSKLNILPLIKNQNLLLLFAVTNSQSSKNTHANEHSQTRDNINVRLWCTKPSAWYEFLPTKPPPRPQKKVKRICVCITELFSPYTPLQQHKSDSTCPVGPVAAQSHRSVLTLQRNSIQDVENTCTRLHCVTYQLYGRTLTYHNCIHK